MRVPCDGWSRRRFIVSVAGSIVATPIVPRFVESSAEQLGGRAARCDGDCVDRPFLVIANSLSDDGSRVAAPLQVGGPESPSVWLESYDIVRGIGSPVTHPVHNGLYVIATTIDNHGMAASFGLMVEYMVEAPGIQPTGLYPILSTVQNQIAPAGGTVTVRSRPIQPLQPNGAMHVVVRAYDPIFDMYRDTGANIYVANDRHLGHRRFS